jgi:hypothetical protein
VLLIPHFGKTSHASGKAELLRYPFFPAVNVPFRAFDTWKRYIGPVLKNWVAWIFTSRSDSNFTCPLTERCKINLAASLASILQTEYGIFSRDRS